MTVESEFARVANEALEKHLGRIETCVAKLTPEQMWTAGGDNQNAIGNLILHLCGNVRQWILSGLGGAADVRERDAEFAAKGGLEVAARQEEMMGRLREIVTEAQAMISRLPADRYLDRVTIQGYHVTKMEAVFHVAEHFVGHTFQIIFATKLLTNQDLGFYAHLSPVSKRAQKPE